MNVFKARLESFTRPKRGKGGTKSQSNQRWPHPEYFLATPETLAEAGFYFDPSSEDKDNVTCYMCGKELSEWDERDDPFEIHYKKCGKKCAWANVRCGLGAEMDADGRFVFTDKNRLPTSKAMEKARLDTFLFGDGWIHDQERNHGASSKKMAKAGFVYSPHDSHDDTAVCIYCGISLSGWDADDGPTEEHRSRVKKAGNPCPMFPDIVFAPPPSRSSKSHSKSKSKSSHVDVTMPMKTYDGSDNETVASDTARMGSVASTSMAKTPKASRTAKKGAKTPRSRSVSRSRTIPVDEEDGVEEPIAKTSKKAPPSTRSRSVSRARSAASVVESDAGTGTEDEVALKRSTSTRSKGKAKDTGTRGGSEEDESGAASKKKRIKSRSQSKTRVSVIPEDISDEDDVEPPTPPPKSTKKSLARKPSTRAVAASKSSTKQKHIDEKPDVSAPAPSTKKVKPISNSVPAAAALFDDDDLEIRADGQIREPESATTARSTRTLRKSTKPSSQSLSSSIVKEKSALTKSASVPRAKSRTPAHNEEEADDDHDALNIQMHVPPLTPLSVESESEPKVEPQEKPRFLETELSNSQSKSRTKQRPPPAHIETDFPEQDTAHPPPVPPRSPSRPKTQHSPASADTDIDGRVVLDLQSEENKPPERAKSDTRETSSTEPPTKPLTVLPKSAAMKKQGSFLSSRSSTQSRTGTSIDHVMDISSDEDDESQVEAAIRMQPLSIQTKSRFLTNIKPHSTSTAISASTVENLESSVPAKGSVQAKIAQIEKHVDMSGETGGKTSPFKPKLASADSFTAEPELNANIVKALEVEDDDIQIAVPSDSRGDKADSEAQQEEKRKISPLPRPAVTPPRSQQQVPTSPFKTPFRFGMGSGNPFSVPPTPGVPLDIPLGIPIPLSQELFVPTQELSETELNMTVEEWVRYHMQIEYDKFKEDGEREIDIFQKRAEQVRNTIGAL